MITPPLDLPSLAPLGEAVTGLLSAWPPGFLLPATADSISNTPSLAATDAYIERLATAVQFPPWVGTAFKMTGLIMLILGMLGWFLSPSMGVRYRGSQLAATGVVLAIVGLGFSAFENLLTYVLTG